MNIAAVCARTFPFIIFYLIVSHLDVVSSQWVLMPGCWCQVTWPEPFRQPTDPPQSLTNVSVSQDTHPTWLKCSTLVNLTLKPSLCTLNIIMWRVPGSCKSSNNVGYMTSNKHKCKHATSRGLYWTFWLTLVKNRVHTFSDVLKNTPVSPYIQQINEIFNRSVTD